MVTMVSKISYLPSKICPSVPFYNKSTQLKPMIFLKKMLLLERCLNEFHASSPTPYQQQHFFLWKRTVKYTQHIRSFIWKKTRASSPKSKSCSLFRRFHSTECHSRTFTFFITHSKTSKSKRCAEEHILVWHRIQQWSCYPVCHDVISCMHVCSLSMVVSDALLIPS